MGQVKLFTNSDPLSLAVTLGTGQRTTMRVRSNGAFFDRNGYVRIFSIQYSDGSYGNFKLLPDNLTADRALRVCKDLLLPVGLTIAGASIFAGESIVYDVVQELFQQGSCLVINDVFERYSILHSSYYAIDNGEHVISHPVQLQLS